MAIQKLSKAPSLVDEVSGNLSLGIKSGQFKGKTLEQVKNALETVKGIPSLKGGTLSEETHASTSGATMNFKSYTAGDVNIKTLYDQGTGKLTGYSVSKEGKKIYQAGEW